MKVGDLVKKVLGDSDLGLMGLVEKIQTNASGYTIFTVITHESPGNRSDKVEPWAIANMGGVVSRRKNWVAEYCELISSAEERLEAEEAMWKTWGDR